MELREPPVARRDLVTVKGPVPREVFRFIAECPGYTKWLDSDVIFEVSRAHIDRWEKLFPNNPITDADGSIAKIRMSVAEIVPYVRRTVPRKTPWKNQARALDVAMSRGYYGFFHDMGTGKTCTMITIAIEKALADGYQQVLLITKRRARLQFINEQLPEHLPTGSPEYVALLVPPATKSGKEIVEYPRGKFLFGVTSAGAFQSKKQTKELIAFCKKRKTLCLVDESQDFKTWSSLRVDNLMKLKPYLPERYLFSGEPTPLGYIDFFAQFMFMDENILGHGTQTSFEREYCVLGGYEGKQIVDYKKVEQLAELIAPHCEFVKITDCMDMPRQVWMEKRFEANEQQRDLYHKMKSDFLVSVERLDNLKKERDTEVIKRVCKNAAGKFIALQQIACGFVKENPHDDGTTALSQVISRERALFTLEECVGTAKHAIIWGRYYEDLDAIADAVREFGYTGVEFSGRVPDDQCELNKLAFQEGKVRIFYGTAASGGTALNLQVANHMIYYSLGTNYNDRAQSARRTWRGGQTETCFYTDVLGFPIDRLMLNNAIKKEDFADRIKSLTGLVQMYRDLDALGDEVVIKQPSQADIELLFSVAED